MKTALLIILVVLIDRATAKEQWFCTDDQAMRQGNSLLICGVGTNATEGDARKGALENALNEFNSMCALSSDCKDHKISVEPKRSTCFENNKKDHSKWDNFTCHRLIVFTIVGK